MYNFYLILIATYISFIDGRFFRNDYQYHIAVEGWLKFHPVPAKWEEARLTCFYEGSTLASPTNEGLLTTMKTAIGQGSVPIFTGFSSIQFNGNYYSIEGVSLQKYKLSWAAGEPNNAGEDQCLAMHPDGTIADVRCDKPLPYICYRKNIQTIPSARACGTVDPEYTFDPRTSHCYKFHRFGQTWARAFLACSAEGGYLAVINSDQEAQVLKELMAKNPGGKVQARHRNYIGIGYRDWSQHGVFMTVHGETLTKAGYDKWAGGQPDNATTGEYCGSIFRDAKLNDIWCEDTIPFICEKLPGSLLENDPDGSADIDNNGQQANIVHKT